MTLSRTADGPDPARMLDRPAVGRLNLLHDLGTAWLRTGAGRLRGGPGRGTARYVDRAVPLRDVDGLRRGRARDRRPVPDPGYGGRKAGAGRQHRPGPVLRPGSGRQLGEGPRRMRGGADPGRAGSPGTGRTAGRAAAPRLPRRLHPGAAGAHLGPGQRDRPAVRAARRPGTPRVRHRPGDRPDDARRRPPRPIAARPTVRASAARAGAVRASAVRRTRRVCARPLRARPAGR